MTKISDIQKAARMRTAMGIVAQTTVNTQGDIEAVAKLVKLIGGDAKIAAALYTAILAEATEMEPRNRDFDRFKAYVSPDDRNFTTPVALGLMADRAAEDVAANSTIDGESRQ